MERYAINPLTRLIIHLAGLSEEKSAQWARGLIVLAFALSAVAALTAI